MNGRVAAIIPAAGSGRRMGGATPKQFLPLAGLPILVHTLKVFDASPLIAEIVLVVPPGTENGFREKWLEPYGIKKGIGIAPGGSTRQDSVHLGLAHIGPETDRVVVHDGVRPFVTSELLHRVLAAGTHEAGAVAAIPLKDTPKFVGEDGFVKSTPERAGLFLAQTPQVFPKKILIEAYRRAYADGVESTDDAALVERLAFPVRIVDGAWDNIKVTTAEDLLLAAKLWEMRRP